jgi:hypothetical protein
MISFLKPLLNETSQFLLGNGLAWIVDQLLLLVGLSKLSDCSMKTYGILALNKHISYETDF